MTHQEFLKIAESHYYDYVKKYADSQFITDPIEVFTVWSCKTANNSKVIIADNITSMLCEATLIGSKNLIVYDTYNKIHHEEHAAI